MCSAVSRLLLLGTARFTADATLSEETDEAGDIKYFTAISVNFLVPNEARRQRELSP